MMELQWHPSLKKTVKGCDVWWQSNMVKRDELGTELAQLTQDLEKQGRFRAHPSTIRLIALALTMQACIASEKNDVNSLISPFRWGVMFRALDFLKTATRSLPGDESQPLIALWTSMKAVGPTMLSDWMHGRMCASYLIAIAHKDMRINHPVTRKEGWGKGTNDAFLVGLFSQACNISTHYESVNPMVEPYRQLLEVWRTTDQDVFRHAMAAAADYHISRSKAGTDRNTYEFEKSFDRVYPGELLAVQALRRRDGLPAFDTGHVLVDTPWSIIRDLPACEPHPLAVALEARLRRDDPECW